VLNLNANSIASPKKAMANITMMNVNDFQEKPLRDDRLT